MNTEVWYVLSYMGAFFESWCDETRNYRNWTNDVTLARDYGSVNGLLLDDLYRLEEIGAAHCVIVQVQRHVDGTHTLTSVTA